MEGNNNYDVKEQSNSEESDFVALKVQEGDDSLHEAEFNRFISFFSEMIIKYGSLIDAEKKS